MCRKEGPEGKRLTCVEDADVVQPLRAADASEDENLPVLQRC